MPQSSYGCGDAHCRSCYEDLNCRRCQVPGTLSSVSDVTNGYECQNCGAFMIFFPEKDELFKPIIYSGTVYKLYPVGRDQYLEMEDA